MVRDTQGVRKELAGGLLALLVQQSTMATKLPPASSRVSPCLREAAEPCGAAAGDLLDLGSCFQSRGAV